MFLFQYLGREGLEKKNVKMIISEFRAGYVRQKIRSFGFATAGQAFMLGSSLDCLGLCVCRKSSFSGIWTFL